MSALWRTGLLLSLLRYSATLGEECILGIIGQPILLPCIYDGELELRSLNFSIEWRRDDDVVHRSVWGAGNRDTRRVSSRNSTRVSGAAPQTGDFSLELSMVAPLDSNTYGVFLTVAGGNHSSPVCSVCLRAAASFSSPQLERTDPVDGDETRFMCHSRGGFPEPVVRWVINDTEPPPEGSVRTYRAPLPSSQLYNITSFLVLNVSQHISVSCTIDNPSMNETLTSISYGLQSGAAVGRATEAMWMFSTGLCVAVGALVLAALFYQIHLDRTYKKHCSLEMGKEGCEDDRETAMMKVERTDTLTETNV